MVKNKVYIALNVETGKRVNIGGGNKRAITLPSLFRGNDYEFRFMLMEDVYREYAYQSTDTFMVRVSSSKSGESLLAEVLPASFDDSLWLSSEYTFMARLDSVIGEFKEGDYIKGASSGAIGKVIYHNTELDTLFYTVVGVTTFSTAETINKWNLDLSLDTEIQATYSTDSVRFATENIGCLACTLSLKTNELYDFMNGADDSDLVFQLIQIDNSDNKKILGQWVHNVENIITYDPRPELTSLGIDFYDHVLNSGRNDHTQYLNKDILTAQDIASVINFGDDVSIAGNATITGTLNGRDLSADSAKLDALVVGNLGWFADETALTTAYPTGSNGQFAMLGSTDTVWTWDSDTVAWVDTGSNVVGDMTKAVYDPTNVSGDAFDMDNMVEGATNKLLLQSHIDDIATISSKAPINNPIFTGVATAPYVNAPSGVQAGSGVNASYLDPIYGFQGAFGGFIRVKNGLVIQGNSQFGLYQGVFKADLETYVSAVNYKSRIISEVYDNAVAREWLRVTAQTGTSKTQLSGLVGIGSTDPETKLVVDYGYDANWGQATIFDNRSAGQGVGGMITLSGYKTGTSSKAIYGQIQAYKENATAGNEAGAVQFRVNNGSTYQNFLSTNSTGDVAIGSHSPVSYGGGYKVLSVKGTSTTQGGAIDLSTSGNETKIEIYVADAGNHIWGATNHPTIFGTNNAERMRIDASGNISVLTGQINMSLYGLKPASYTTGTLPSASARNGMVLWDSTTGTPKISDGTSWLEIQTI